jgi:hypothetical protein
MAMASRQSEITAVQLHLAAKCDNCPFCFSEDGFGSDGAFVPLDVLTRRAQMLLDYHACRPFRHVNLLSGEPLLYPWLGDFAAAFGRRLPLAIITLGVPPGHDVDLESAIAHIDDWALTYDPGKLDRLVPLATRLLEARRHVITTFKFTDFDSFVSLQTHFLERAVPELPLSADWVRQFTSHFRWWTAANYSGAFYRPFIYPTDGYRQMVIRYTSFDTRFSRVNPPHVDPPYIAADRAFTCHLFVRNKAIAIADDGRVFPCASIGQRHTTPVIADIDALGRLPIDLPEYLDACAEALRARKGNDICDISCKHMSWRLDDGRGLEATAWPRG